MVPVARNPARAVVEHDFAFRAAEARTRADVDDAEIRDLVAYLKTGLPAKPQ